MRKLMWLLVLMLVGSLGCEDNTELIDKLTTENSQLQTDLTQLNIGLASIQANLKELEAERDRFKKELGLLQKDRDDVIEERDRLKKEIVELDGKINDLQKLSTAYASLVQIDTPEAIWAAVPVLMQALKDEDATVRANAVGALGFIGGGSVGGGGFFGFAGEVPVDVAPAVTQAVPALIQALQDKDKEVRRRTTTALGQIGLYQNMMGTLTVKDAVPVLIQLFQAQDEDEEIRANAVMALGQIGSQDAVSVLIQALKDQDAEGFVRANAAKALGFIGGGPFGFTEGGAVKDVVSVLIQTLQDEDNEVRANAVEALAQISLTGTPGVEDAVPALIQAL